MATLQRETRQSSVSVPALDESLCNYEDLKPVVDAKASSPGVASCDEQAPEAATRIEHHIAGSRSPLHQGQHQMELSTVTVFRTYPRAFVQRQSIAALRCGTALSWR